MDVDLLKIAHTVVDFATSSINPGVTLAEDNVIVANAVLELSAEYITHPVDFIVNAEPPCVKAEIVFLTFATPGPKTNVDATPSALLKYDIP